MINVLVGSVTSALLLAKLLADEQAAGQIELRRAHPTSSLYSAARTILQIRDEPVALVLDANSTEPSMAARARDEAAEVIGDPADGSTFRILVAVPGLQSLLFRRPEAIRRAYANTSAELIDLGLVSPGDALRKMAGTADRDQAASAIIAGLDAEDLAALRLESPVAGLLSFLAEQGGNLALAHPTFHRPFRGVELD